MNDKSEIRAKRASAAIARVRAEGKNAFTTKEFIALLRTSGCPYPHVIPKALTKSGLIIQKKGICTFTSTKPVLYTTLLSTLNTASKDYVESSEHYKKRVEDNISKFPVSWKEVDAELHAEYLKGLGYKIFKQTFVEI